MSGIGPRREPGTPDSGTTADAAGQAGTWASQQAYRLGREHERARLLDPQAGYDMGHDVGYSADTEHRAYVHGVMRGFEAGNDARKEFGEELLRGSYARTKAERDASQAALDQPEEEREAEAS